MTAIVAGQGLGLINTSLGLLGGQGQVGQAGQGRSGEKVVVNAATGNLVIQQQDEWLVGVGPDVGILRTYNSMAASSGDGDNNDNWRLGLSRKITAIALGSQVTRIAEDGSELIYTWDASRSLYVNKAGGGSFDTLKWDGVQWTWTDGDSRIQEVYEMNAGVGRLLSVTDTDGKKLTLTYTGNLITKVVTASAETVFIDYYSGTSDISQIRTVKTDGTLTRVRYTYDGSHRLTQVTVDLSPEDNSVATGKVYITAYTYDGASKRVKTLIQSDGTLSAGSLVANSTLSFTYETSGQFRVKTVTELIGTDSRTTSFAYDDVNGVTTITDPLAQETKLSFDTSAYSGSNAKAGQLLSIKAPQVGGIDQITRFNYSSEGNLDSIVDARGNTVVYRYDANGNRSYERDTLGNVVERSYSATNQLLTQTSYSGVDPDGDGSQPPTGGMTSRYVYDTTNGHLRYAITPKGSVTEYIYNGSGQLQSTLQYNAAYDLTGLSSTATPTLSQLGTWTAGSAVDKTKLMRVDYAYDFRGQLKSQTAFSKTDSAGNGMLDDTQSVTQYVYDQAGNLLQRIDGRGAELTTLNTLWATNERVRLGKSATAAGLSAQDIKDLAARYSTVYVYDGLNRITSQLEAQVDGELTSVTTLTQYNDNDRSTTVKKTALKGGSTVTLSKGLVTVSAYDEAGRLVSVASTGDAGDLGTTRYTYDKLGRLVMVKTPGSAGNADGDKTFYLYDAQSRRIAQIDAEGALTEYRYNQNNQVVRTIGYATKVTAANLSTLEAGMVQASVALASIRPAENASADHNSWNIYDAAGRLVVALSTISSIDGSDTEQVRQTSYSYDAAGRLLSQRQHYTPVLKVSALKSAVGEITRGGADGRSLFASGAQLNSTLSQSSDNYDRVSRSYYSEDGQRIGELDAENYYSAYTYDAAGRLQSSLRYATVIAAAPSGNTPPTPTPDPTLDQKTKYFYNGNGQLTGQVDAENYYTAYVYDTAGNRIKETRYAKAVAKTFDAALNTPSVTADKDRVTTYSYDGNNRLLQIATSPNDQLTVNTYDGMGNLLSSTTTVKALGYSSQARATQRQYDSFGRVTHELGGVGSAALAALGGSASQAAKDTVWNTYATRYFYDNAGRLTAKIEPNGSNDVGNTTVYYYDKAGNLTHSINALGEIVQYGYNAFGQRTQTRTLNTRLKDSDGLGAISALKGGSSLAVNTVISGLFSTSKDTVALRSYNRAGQLYSTTSYFGTGSAQANRHTFLYDTLGNLAEEDSIRIDNTQLWTTYAYDRRGLRTTTSNSNDSALELSHSGTVYDAFGRVVATTDGKDVRTDLSYDKLGRVVYSYAPGSSTLGRMYAYDAFGRTLSSTEPDGNYTSYAYDDLKRQVTITTMEGAVSVRTLDSAGELVEFKDANGNTTKYGYDADGRLLSTTTYDKSGASVVAASATVYDTAGRVSKTKDGRDTVTTLKYDAANRVLTRTVDEGGLNLTTNYRYDAKGQAVWSQDANGVWTQTVFDRNGRISSITVDPAQIPASGNAQTATADQLSLVANPSPAGALAIVTQYTYGYDNQVLRVTQGLGTPEQVITEYAYDEQGRRISETVDPDGTLKLKTSYTYDGNGNVLTRTDAKGQVTRYAYDKEGQRAYTIEATGAVTRNEYDVNGHLSRVTGYAGKLTAAEMATTRTADEWTSFMQTRANAGADHVTSYVYDKDGRLTHTVDAKGGVTELQYDGNGNVIQQTRYFTTVALGAGVSTEGHVTFSKPAITAKADKDQVTRYVYDEANRRTWTLQTDYVSSANVQYASRNVYDKNGNVIAQTRYSGKVQTRATAVQSLGSNEVGITATGSQIAGTEVGNLYLVADSTQDQTNWSVYDKANRAVYVIDAENYVTQNTYDNNGHLKSSTRFAKPLQGGAYTAGADIAVKPAGTDSGSGYWLARTAGTDASQDQTSTYGWDAAGRQTTLSVTDSNNATLSSTSKAYNAIGNIRDAVDANGTGQDVTTHYNYDTAGRVVDKIEGYRTDGSGPSRTDYADTRYILDEVGNRVGIIDPRAIELAEGTTDWAQQQRQTILGNPNPPTKSTDPASAYQQLLRRYTTTQAFDAKGRVTRITDPLSNTTETDYDAFGNAIRVKDPNGNYGYFYFDQLSQATWQVDPMGYATQTEYDTLGQVTQITKYATVVNNQDKLASSTVAPMSPAEVTAYQSTHSGAAPTTPYLSSATQDAVTKIEHDLLGRQTKITDAETYFESMKYDALGNKVSYTNKLGGEFKYTYDKLGNLKEETLPVKVYQYDSTGAILNSSRDGDGKPNTVVRNQYSYDARGNRTKAVEAVGLSEERATIYTYDALNRQLSKVSQTMDIYTTNSDALVSDTPSTLTVVDGKVTKLNGTDQKWDNASFHSAQGYVGGASISFKPVGSSGNGYFFIGLSTKSNSSNYSDLDWCFFGGYGGVSVYKKGGVGISGVPSTPYSADDTLTITYDGAKIRFLRQNSVESSPQEIYSQAFTTDQPLYAAGYLLTPGFAVDKVRFGQCTYVNGVATNKVTPTDTTRYDARGNVIESRAPDGGRTLYYYDALNRKTAQVSATNTLSTYAYNGAGDLLSTTTYGDAVNPQAPLTPINANNARTTFYSYDQVGRKLTICIKGTFVGEVNTSTGNFEFKTQDLVNSITYDANGNLASETDARGYTTWHFYDKAGNEIWTVDAQRFCTYRQFNGAGAVTDETKFATPLSTMVQLYAGLSPAAILTAVTSSPDDRHTQYVRDKLGRVTDQYIYQVASVSKEISNSIHDANKLTETTGSSHTSYLLDGLGNITQKTEATGEIISWEFDAQGRLTKEIGATFTDYQKTSVKQSHRTEYNALGLIARRVEIGASPSGSDDQIEKKFVYSTNGLLKTAFNLAQRTDYQTDAAGRITFSSTKRGTADAGIDPHASTFEDKQYIAYNQLGQEVQSKTITTEFGWYQAPPSSTWTQQQTDTELQRISVSYNAFGDIVNKGTNGGSQEQSVYDTAGHLLISNSGDGVLKAYVYDAAGNCTMTITPTGTFDVMTDPLTGKLTNLVPGTASYFTWLLGRADTHVKVSSYDAKSQSTDTFEASAQQIKFVVTAAEPSIASPNVGGSNQVAAAGVNSPAAEMLYAPTQITAGFVGNIGDIKISLDIQKRLVYYVTPQVFCYNYVADWTISIPSLSSLGPGDIVVSKLFWDKSDPNDPYKWSLQNFRLKDSASGSSLSFNDDRAALKATAGTDQYNDYLDFAWNDHFIIQKETSTGLLKIGNVNFDDIVSPGLFVPGPGSGANGLGLLSDTPNSDLFWGDSHHFDYIAPKQTPTRTICINNIPAASTSTLLRYKPINSDSSSWSTLAGSVFQTFDGSQIPGDGNWYATDIYRSKPAKGSQYFDWSQIPNGNSDSKYDVEVLTLDAQGTILTSSKGILDLRSTASPTISLNAQAPKISAIKSSAKTIDINGLGASATTGKIKFRERVPDANWTPSFNLVPVSSYAPAGWFQFAPSASQYGLAANKTYDYVFETTDEAGKPKKVLGSFQTGTTADSVATVATAVPYQNLPQRFTFQSIPTAATRARVVYWPSSTTNNPITVELPTPDYPGTFTWDAVDLGLSLNTSTAYNFKLYTFDANGRQLSATMGSVNVGPSGASINASTLVTFNNPYELKLDVPFGTATNVTVSYMLAGDTSLRTKSASKGADGLFTFDLSANVPITGSVDLQYYYAAFNGSTPLTTADKYIGGLYSGSGLIPTASAPSFFKLTATASAPVLASNELMGLTNSNLIAHHSQTFNAFGEIAKQIDANGNETRFVYNTMGKLIDKIDPKADVVYENGFVQKNADIKTHYVYDLQGRLVSMVDANAHVTNYALRAAGGGGEAITAATYQVGTSTTNRYDVFGDLRESTDGNGHTTKYTYDTNHRVVLVNRPIRDDGINAGMSAFDAYTYDAKGNRISHITSDNAGSQATAATNHLFTDKIYYDGLGRVVLTSSAEGRKTSYTYLDGVKVTGINGVSTIGAIKTTKDANGKTITDESDIFGHVTKHTNMAGQVFNYTYNAAGWLTDQTSLNSVVTAQNSGQNIHYDYYTNGQAKDIVDRALNTVTLYAYDKQGNKTFEGYATVDGSNFYAQTQITYDALNRMKAVTDASYALTYAYDAAGNRRHLTANYTATPSANVDYWYRYDALNRMVVSMGTLSGTTATSASDQSASITQGTTGNGVSIQYDAVGNRKKAIYVDHTEIYNYTTDNYLLDVTQPNKTTPDSLLTIAKRTYDLLGRVQNYMDYQSDGKTIRSNTSYVYDKDGKVKTSTDLTTEVVTTNFLLADGSMEHSTYTASNTTYTTTYAYVYLDGQQQQSIAYAANNSNVQGWQPGLTTFAYDVNGHVKQVVDTRGNRTMNYLNNAQGLVLNRTQIAAGGMSLTANFYYVNGATVAETGTDPDRSAVSYTQALAEAEANKSDKARQLRPILSSGNSDQNYIPISPTYPGFTAGGYTVKDGDTLQSIALALWGDSAMWYLIADANGLMNSKSLTPGNVLIIPNKVTNVHNNSNTHAVYDPSHVLGNTQPTLPDPPPPPAADEGCGGVGVVLMIVVAIAVACVVGPAVLGMFSAAGVGVGSTVAGTIAAGVAEGSVAVVGAGLTAAAVGAAAGSIASQAVGMATGNVQSFSWSQVGRSAVMGAISAGATAAANASGLYAVGDAGKAVSGWGAVGQGALSGAISQQLARGLGLAHGKFSWTGVAASAAASGAGYKFDHADFLGGALSNLGDGDILKNTASGVVSGWAGAMARHDKPNWVGIADNALGQAIGGAVSPYLEKAGFAFGSALGDSVVSAIQRGDANKQQSNGKRYDLSGGLKLGYGAGEGSPQLSKGAETSFLTSWDDTEASPRDALYLVGRDEVKSTKAFDPGGHTWLMALAGDAWLGQTSVYTNRRFGVPELNLMLAGSQWPDENYLTDAKQAGVRIALHSPSAYFGDDVTGLSQDLMLGQKALHNLNGLIAGDNINWGLGEIDKFRGQPVEAGVASHPIMDAIAHTKRDDGVDLSASELLKLPDEKAPEGHLWRGVTPDLLRTGTVIAGVEAAIKIYEHYTGVSADTLMASGPFKDEKTIRELIMDRVNNLDEYAKFGADKGMSDKSYGARYQERFTFAMRGYLTSGVGQGLLPGAGDLAISPPVTGSLVYRQTKAYLNGTAEPGLFMLHALNAVIQIENDFKVRTGMGGSPVDLRSIGFDYSNVIPKANANLPKLPDMPLPSTKAKPASEPKT